MVEAARTPGVLAENDVLVAGQTVSADKGLVEAANQNVSAANEALRGVSQMESYLTITAPFAGVVTTRNLNPVALIGPASGAKSEKVPVTFQLDVKNTEGRLSPGSFTNVSWPLQRGYPTLFVPTTSVTSDQQHTFVIRVRSGKAEWVTVQTGQTVNGDIEVFGDLIAGEEVVKTASDAIHSGDSVRVQDRASAVK